MEPLQDGLGNTEVHVHGMNTNGLVVTGVDSGLDHVESQNLGRVHAQALGNELVQGEFRPRLPNIPDANSHRSILPAVRAGKETGSFVGYPYDR